MGIGVGDRKIHLSCLSTPGPRFFGKMGVLKKPHALGSTCRVLLLVGFAALLANRLATFAQAGELGAFFVPATVSAFEQGPRQGARIPLKPGTAYAVIGLGWEGGERLWLRLNVPERQQAVRGEGWTPLTAEELTARGTGLVEVYTRPVEPGQAPTSGPVSVQVPANQVQSRGEGDARKAVKSTAMPQLTWQPVRYSAQRSAQPWIAASQGVYRPARTPVFLMSAFQDMAEKKIPGESVRRLLAGVVRVGDSAQEARWAWGEPLRTWNEGADAKGADGQKRTVWEYAEGQLRFAGAAVAEVR